MSNVVIQQALEARLQEFAAARSIPVFWENEITQQPDPESAYLIPYFIPNVTDSIDLQQRTKVYQGIFQITVVWPAGMGTIGAKQLAEDVADHFPNGWDAGVVFTDRPTTVAGGLLEDVSYNVPVSVYYRAHI